MLTRRHFTQASASTLVLASCVSDLRSQDKPLREFTVKLDNRFIVHAVFQDDKISHPYFDSLKTLDGTQVTRHHPPRAGIDLADHDLMHPGLWLSFGDLNGQDYWRLKAPVIHEKHIGEARSFTAVRRYQSSDGQALARETCRYAIEPLHGGWLMTWDSTFDPLVEALTFGDQEEMGLGLRLATPLTVKNGGTILASHGGRDEKGCWGKVADWCDYSGVINGKRSGILLMPHPKNHKPSTFHVRDYGLMVANPFAEQAFGLAKEPAKTVIKKGDKLQLGFGLLVYAQADEKPLDAAKEWADYNAALSVRTGEKKAG